MYLLDTNVVSELRKVGTGKADAAVVAWARMQSNHALFLSAISVMEFEIGICANSTTRPSSRLAIA